MSKIRTDYIRLLKAERDQLKKENTELRGEIKKYTPDAFNDAIMKTSRSLALSMYDPDRYITVDGRDYLAREEVEMRLNDLERRFTKWTKKDIEA